MFPSKPSPAGNSAAFDSESIERRARVQKRARGRAPGKAAAALVALAALLVAALALPFAPASASSRRAAAPASAPSAAPAPPPATAKPAPPRVSAPRGAFASTAAATVALQLIPPAETVETFEADCTTPKTSFALGDTVCAKASGAPLPFVGGLTQRRFYWVDPAGHVLRITPITQATQTDLFTLPSADTTEHAPGDVSDNRGEWAVNSVSWADSSVRVSTNFDVSGAQATADIGVYKSVTFASAKVKAGSNVTFRLFVYNAGPNPAANVTLTDAVPANMAFESAIEPIGPGFNCTHPAQGSSTGESVCTIDSLPTRARVGYEFTYKVNAGTLVGSRVTNAATVASETTDPRPSNNSSSSSALVVLVDDDEDDPAPTCTLTCPANVVATANTTQGGQPGTFVKFGAAAVSGECGAVSNSPASGSFFTVGTHTITSTSQTGGGSCTFTVKVLDTPAPTISCPANKSATAGPEGTANVLVGTPTFNAAGGGTVVGVRSDSIPAVIGEDGTVITPAVDRDLTDPYPVGIVGITWTVTDADGRTASCRQRIVVRAGLCGEDNESPVITSAPPDITVGTGPGNTSPTVALDDELGQLEATDNCSVNVTISGVPPGNAFPIGTTQVTHTATDNSGNSVSHVQQVTVIDNTPPFIAAPPDAAYTCPSQVPTAHPSQATRGDVFDEDGNLLPPGPPFDNSGTVSVTVTETSTGAGSAASPLVITRVFKATDPANNSSEATQIITVTDATPPSITAPADATYQCAFEVPAASASQATASDNCSVNVGVVETNNGGAGTIASPLVITRTFTATDGAGNTANDAQTITVIDDTPPSVNAPADVTVFLPLNSPATSMAVSYPNPATASDNCGGNVGLAYSPASGSTFPVGTTTVTVTATDDHGNSATDTFTVTVLYNFTGFFSPVSNLPVLNTVNAGRTIPVKFSLSGNKGLGIFADGSPASGPIACDANAIASEVTETLTTGGSSLTYSSGDQYHYNWKTDSSWAGTCRQLVVTLNDGSIHRANFKFK
jgi:uncharacterized repeat protein (TIGR01451 family)